MQTHSFSLAQLEPAFDRESAVPRNQRLPVGGPYGSGGNIPKGTILGAVGGSPANEVRTLTVGTSTGPIVSTFTADKPYPVSHANNASLAIVQAAWDAVFGKGNVTVTGTPGTNYILTFSGMLAQSRIGGKMDVSSNGTAAWARTTPGSAGGGQYDVYIDAGTNNAPNTARCILACDYASTPTGDLLGEGLNTGQPFQPVCWMAGYFFTADLLGFDTPALADPGWRLVEGSGASDAGAVVGLGV